MKLQVRLYGNDALRRASVPVATITPDVRKLAADMLETMYAANGVGLAAQQVGRTESLCVIDIPKDEKGVRMAPIPDGVPMPLVLINPRVVGSSGSLVSKEGCLSFPELYAEIRRAAEVTVEYMDLEGKPRRFTCAELLARAIQHELDHLKAVLIVDHMSMVQKTANAGRLRRLKREGMHQDDVVL